MRKFAHVHAKGILSKTLGLMGLCAPGMIISLTLLIAGVARQPETAKTD